jgi:oxygen-independent coproporphyrinogen-3 oxidase
VRVSEWDAAPVHGDLGELGEVDGPRLPAHFYFHVPFCRARCSYCDFYSIPDADPDDASALFACMAAEMRRWRFSALPGVVETLYVGGGTPSLYAPAVGELIEDVREELPVREDAEITVEANPDSLTPAALQALIEGGANRISVGVQAFDDTVLRLLGRLHDARQARAAIALVRDAGLELSIDLMCGVPGQTLASWAESLEQALDAGAKHVSVYPLSIEEGTPLEAAIRTELVSEPDPDLAAEMMILAEKRLAQAGLARYEVANFAVPGHESRHNSAYWTGAQYVGTGPGAHGMLDPVSARTMGLWIPSEGRRDVARVRYANLRDLDGWLRGGAPEIELLSADEVAREDVMLGMRLAHGVSAAQVSTAGLDEVLASLAKDGLVELVAGCWRATSSGWLLGNEVFGRIWNAGQE